MGFFSDTPDPATFNLDRLEMWADELLSGKYLQVRSNLRARIDEDDQDALDPQYGYCCLGVACIVANEAAGLVLPWTVTTPLGLTSSASNAYPPAYVNQFFGGELRFLRLDIVNAQGATCTPAYANDRLGASFEVIGNAVKRYVATARAKVN